MTLKSFFKAASLGAGAVVLMTGLVLAQSAPPPAAAPPAAPKSEPRSGDGPGYGRMRHDGMMREDRAFDDEDDRPRRQRGQWRRDGGERHRGEDGERGISRREMRQVCFDKLKSEKLTHQEMREKMSSCIRNETGEARIRRERQNLTREKVRDARNACFETLKDQRLTVDERRGEMQKCVLAKVPEHAKQMTCRQEAETKKLERRSQEFRAFMRQCMTAP